MENLLTTNRLFKQYAGDFLESTRQTYTNNLNQFKNFCDNSPIIAEILQPIKETDYDTSEWFNRVTVQQSSMVGSGNFALPIGTFEPLKVIYDLLWDENSYDRCISLIFATMFTEKYDDMIIRFHENLTIKLIRYIDAELSDKINTIEAPLKVATTYNNYIYGQANVAQGNSNVTQHLNVNTSEVSDLISEFRKCISTSTELSPEEQEDALETIDLIEEETKREKPKESRIKKFIDTLPAIEGVVSIGEKILELINA